MQLNLRNRMNSKSYSRSATGFVIGLPGHVMTSCLSCAAGVKRNVKSIESKHLLCNYGVLGSIEDYHLIG
jgi:hypothetical protein